MPLPVRENVVQRNGKPTLAEHLRRRLPESVEIGSTIYTDRPEDDTASWEDVRQIVAGVRWLLKGWLPAGVLVGLIGQPKQGKSAFALGALARPIVLGRNWFTGLPATPGCIVWADTESSAAINIERARAWGLPMDRVKVPFADDPLRPIDLANDEDMNRVFNVVCRYRAPLLVVDSFRGSHTQDENNSKIAGVLRRLANIAEQTRTAVALVHHTRKMLEGEELSANSGRGSNAFLAMVRLQIAIDRPDPNGEWRRARVLGENFGVSPAPLGFRFTDSGLDFGQAPRRPHTDTRKEGAKAWLVEFLKGGKWVPAKNVLTAAEQFGLSANALQRAREELGITLNSAFIRRRTDGCYEWKLPTGGK